MAETHADLIIQGAELISSKERKLADVAVRDGKIAKIGQNLQEQGFSAERTVDGQGKVLFPGIIDSQVHFREPGLVHKEDLESGSRAAALGGVTTFLEMPNTKPPTTSIQALKEKLSLAAEKCWVDHGFFIGAGADNIEELKKARDLEGCCGIKIFLGSSTGDLLLYNAETLKNIFREIHGFPIAVHSENEERLRERINIRNNATSPLAHPDWRDVEVCLSSTKRVVDLARSCGRGVHVLHVTTEEEMDFLKENKDLFTVEVTPQHLTFSSPTCYEKLGTRVQMNPPIREERHRQGLWKALQEGTVDVIGSDHAPHTLEEKSKDYPDTPSGMPGVQTTLHVMLEHVAEGQLSLEKLTELLCERPAELYSMDDRGRLEEGLKADMVLVDLAKKTTLRDENMASKSGWTPFHGREVQGSIERVFLSGSEIVRDGQLQTEHPRGLPAVN